MSEGTTGDSAVLWPAADDPEWTGFCAALYWLLGSRLSSGCDHSTRHARLLLEARGYDADASLRVYASQGGYCDCEVLWNTDPR
jgi:hypothetical protein